MKIAKFTRCVDSGDLATIKTCLGDNYDYNERCPGMNCITMHAINNFTQQEQDDITALAAANFLMVEFIF